MKILILGIVCVTILAWLYIRRAPALDKPRQSSRTEVNASAFANMRVETKWDLEGDMLWGFFFTNPTKPPLEPVAKQLAERGYRVVDIYLDDKKKNWWLHVEKIETHTVESLTQREDELSDIAAKARLGSYDGWDVGPVAK